MTLQGKDATNFEYALDMFKGTCLLNDYKVLVGEPLIKEDGNYFYYSTRDKIEFGVSIKEKVNIYEKTGLINLAVKALNNMGIYDLKVRTDNKEIIENLKLIDIDIENSKISENEFEVILDGRVLAKGTLSNDTSSFTIDYEDIKDLVKYEANDELDLCVKPLEENVFSDAFAISTNLKDAGFRVKTDYSLDKKKEINNTAFLVSFDANDIKKYVVKFKDLHTNEEKEVMIDNLIEELTFF